MTVRVVLLLLVVGCAPTSLLPPTPSPTPAPIVRDAPSPVPLTEEQYGWCGMAIDFLGALIGRSELKARSYLAAGDRRGVSELRRSAQISAQPTSWTMGRCAFGGDAGYVDVHLHLSDRQQIRAHPAPPRRRGVARGRHRTRAVIRTRSAQRDCSARDLTRSWIGWTSVAARMTAWELA